MNNHLENIIENGEIGEYWLIIDKFYHPKFYKSDYPDHLISFLKSFNAHKILDVSCGIGFPSIELIKRGFPLVCSDGSESMLKVFARRIKEEKLDVPFYHCKWFELPEKIKDKFDTILCLDSSITHVDSWGLEDEFDIEKAKENIQKSINAFYKMLNSGGHVVIGLGKYAFGLKQSETIDYGSLIIDSKEIQHKWIFEFDYVSKKKTWHTIFILDGKEYKRTFFSYMLTGDEMEDMLKVAGFSDITIKEIVSGEYDKNFIAVKK